MELAIKAPELQARVSFPDEIWTMIIHYASESRCMLSHMLQVSRRMLACAYASVTALTPHHKNISSEILLQLGNLQRASLRNNRGAHAMTRLTNLRLDMQMINQTVDLTMHHLTELAILTVCTIVNLPVTLVCLSIHSNPSIIDLSPHSMLTKLTVMQSPRVTGIETLTQLRWLQLCSNTYMRGNNIAAMTRLHTLRLDGIKNPDIPSSVTDLSLTDCNIVQAQSLTTLCNLSLFGQTRVSGITPCIQNIVVDDMANIITPSYDLFTNLRQIACGRYEIISYFDDVRVLTQLRMLSNLRGVCLPSLTPLINIRDLSIGNAGNMCIESLPTLLHLTKLTLGFGCIMTDAQLSVLTALTNLNVRAETITYAGISQLTNLTKLNLRRDTVMHEFTSLVRLRYLTFVKPMKSPQLIRLPLGIEILIISSTLVKLEHNGANPADSSVKVATRIRRELKDEGI